MKIKKIIVAVLQKFSFGQKIIRARRKKGILSQYGVKDRQELFTHYFETNLWGSEESVSGPGSTIEYTENIQKEIPLLIERLGIKKILDAPCGDYNWFRFVQRKEDIDYLGGDIVKPLVKHNQEVSGNLNTSFMHLDILKDDLPASDLWLCRDCLFHLSNADIFRAINNFMKSDIQYLLTSTHPKCENNTDIATGAFREINLELPPFSFGDPLFAMEDWIEGFPVRNLALWEKQQLVLKFRSSKKQISH